MFYDNWRTPPPPAKGVVSLQARGILGTRPCLSRYNNYNIVTHRLRFLSVFFSSTSFPGHLLGRTRMVGGRRGRRRGEKGVPGVVEGVLAEAHQHAVSQLLQAGQAKSAGDLQLHAVRERRGKRPFGSASPVAGRKCAL